MYICKEIYVNIDVRICVNQLPCTVLFVLLYGTCSDLDIRIHVQRHTFIWMCVCERFMLPMHAHSCYICIYTHTQNSWHFFFTRDPSQSYRHDSSVCDMTWLIRTWHDSFTGDMTHSCVAWLIHVWHDSFICDMTHSFVTWLTRMWHNSFTADMTYSCAIWLVHRWHDAFTCDMTDSYGIWLIHTWHDSSICGMIYSRRALLVYLERTHSCVTWLIHTWHDLFYVTWEWLFHTWHDRFMHYMTYSSVIVYMTDYSYLARIPTSVNVLFITHACVTWLIHAWPDS